MILPMTDGELIALIRQDSQTAWNELVDRHSGVLWRLARSIVADDHLADEAMQTAWLALLQHLDRIAEAQAVLSWLMTTTRREATALARSMDRYRAADPLDWTFDLRAEAGDGPAERVANRDRDERVLAVLATLGERCRQLLTLLAHQVEYRLIAATLELAVGSIGPIRERCLSQLRGRPEVADLRAAL